METDYFMGHDLLRVIFYSFSMFIASYAAGYLPLYFNLSEKMIAYTSSLGAGLLIGTALAVIIPEGVNTLYSTENVVNTLDTSDQLQTDYRHVYLGTALVTGFLLMLIIDQLLFRDQHSHGHEEATISLPTSSEKQTSHKRTNQSTATIGLVVHSAADGIALGAASASGHSHVELLIFIAIMLHKAPAAFGLTSILLHAGCEKRKIKRHLLLFAVTAPIASLIIFLLLTRVYQEAVISDKINGIALLFSAGTFLYVATVHVIPELSQGKIQLGRCEVVYIIVGSILPLLFSVMHQH
ncbi:Zinc transporter ZIP9-like [Oopsacas minuta]|uniref:Zinc transporter ZIP9-like n=1 Tax=Oopsacas minuta TaxID=111878 RepID=A0AAV7JU78_9METZ|nr:Zinc transporter ZIP9-like [Oopsacas minuta]